MNEMEKKSKAGFSFKATTKYDNALGFLFSCSFFIDKILQFFILLYFTDFPNQ